MVKCKEQEGDSNRGAISSRVTEVDEAEAEDKLGTASGATSVAVWDIQLQGVPCECRVNNSRNSIEEAQEVSHGGHPEQAGVVLATEDEDRHGQPQ